MSRQPLHEEVDALVSDDGDYRYNIDESGIPCFAERFLSADAKAQEEHYESIAEKYIENLGYPHTLEYASYLDERLLAELPAAGLGVTAELCCGRGEALKLMGDRMRVAVGIDVSRSMLRGAIAELDPNRCFLAQGDATMLPLAEDSFDSVVMLGGIHHIPARQKLFSEVYRVLRPGGRFYWREPVSDLFLWRWLRALIYRVSPTLDHETERPLRWRETVPLLDAAGLKLLTWKTYGFVGFCLFMNSDVLVFNRVFRYVPRIRTVVRLSAMLDDWTVRLPLLRKAGLQVVGVAQKPMERNS